jgi:hypothetical protein
MLQLRTKASKLFLALIALLAWACRGSSQELLQGQTYRFDCGLVYRIGMLSCMLYQSCVWRVCGVCVGR